MIGLLRLIGVFNAAIWLGGTIFFAVVTVPALSSGAMLALLRAKTFPYFSPAITHIVRSEYFQFTIICALIALLHFLIEWLYLGRPAWRKLGLGLLAGLLVYGMIGHNLLQPHLKSLHTTRFSVQAKPAHRAAASKSYSRWETFSYVMNFVVIGGLIVYFWRITNPAEAPRFISSVKFRG
ncbi:MAG: hypothetical protein H7Y43_07390 [Akkermansiaceae bacterium]|nr:hypothetical protein [Verrucomicrobiales bacterium]